MIKNDSVINALLYGDIVEKVSKKYNVTITEARNIMSSISFVDYVKLIEASADIVPPSGNAVGQQQPNSSQKQMSNTPQKQSSNTPPTWTGKGTPTIGMTVGLQGPNNVPTPGVISKVDMSTKGVTVKDPVTNQETTMNLDALQPFIANMQDKSQQNVNQMQQTTEQKELLRLRELAGIKEDASGGASCAGAMGASTPVPLSGSNMIKRKKVEVEESPSLEHPIVGRKSIHGDDSHTASGKLSANNVMRGKKTASRKNNGQ